jgi:hypothetical protein
MKELCVVLYCLGLSYQGTRDLLDDLGCALSPATIRKNVIGSSRPLARRGPRLWRVGPGQVAGGEGRLSLRVIGIPTTNRRLEVIIEPGPGAEELRWQVEHCARWIADQE